MCVSAACSVCLLQAYLDKATQHGDAHKGSGAAPRLTAVMFGGPNVGDAAFATYFNRRVNARNVQYKYDIVRQVPCAPQITACPHLLVPVPTFAGNSAGAWQYERVGGQIRLDLGDIPVQREVWSKLAVFTQQDFCRTTETVLWNVDALHYCSYFCSLGAYAGQASWCKLWPEATTTAEKGATYCFQGVASAQFPKSPVFPFQ